MMPDPPKRVVAEKSRTVRRRYQRSNKRFQFTPSQIAYLDREEEREKRARNLREKEKKRLANKKNRAQKEAQEREERRRLGLPNPNALPVPSSQPLLSKFLVKPKTSLTPVPESGDENGSGESGFGEGQGITDDGDDVGGDTEPDNPGGVEGEADKLESDDWDVAECADTPGDSIIAMAEGTYNQNNDSTIHEDHDHNDGQSQSDNADNNDDDGDDDDDDGFSDCSVFYDEMFVQQAEINALLRQAIGEQSTPRPETIQPRQQPPSHRTPALEESFRDDTVDILEEFAGEFDEEQDDEFEKELLELGVG